MCLEQTSATEKVKKGAREQNAEKNAKSEQANEMRKKQQGTNFSAGQ